MNCKHNIPLACECYICDLESQVWCLRQERDSFQRVGIETLIIQNKFRHALDLIVRGANPIPTARKALEGVDES